MGNFTKPVDLERLSAEAASGAPLAEVVLRGDGGFRLFLPCLLVFQALNQLLLLHGQHHPGSALVLFMLWVGLFVLVLRSARARLRISETGIEIFNGFRGRIYRFADITGPFELLQNKVAPGFDIVFPVRGGAPKGRLRPSQFYAAEHVLLELLTAYRDLWAWPASDKAHCGVRHHHATGIGPA